MQYTLITPQGQVQQFFILAVAELYQTIYGGVVITPQILVEQLVDAQTV